MQLIHSTPRRGQRGVSLIEVLVSLFIVSMGILALAGLLTKSSRFGKASESRAIATLLANDLADRIRANSQGLAGNTTMYDWTPGSYSATMAAPAPPAKVETDCTAAANCLNTEIAAIDLYRWKQRLVYSLPGGYGYVKYNAGNATNAVSVDVWVAWTDAISAAYSETAASKECPPGFSGTGVRCVYVEVGL